MPRYNKFKQAKPEPKLSDEQLFHVTLEKLKESRKESAWKPLDLTDVDLSRFEFGGMGGLEVIENYDVVNGEIVLDQRKGGDNGPPKKRAKIVSEKSKKNKQKKKNREKKENDQGKKKENDQGKEQTEDNKDSSDKEGKKLKNKKLLKNWKKFDLPRQILLNLEEKNFVKPTEIQQRAIPAAMEKKHVLAAAMTGSGKTLSFGIPIVSTLMKAEKSDKLKALVLTPTRELAIQVNEHLKAIAKNTGVFCVAIVGGMSEEKQKRLLSYHPSVIVATPGRLWNLMHEDGNEFLSDLSDLSYLVFDEADRMVADGHYKELDLILDKIKHIKRNCLQKFVTSATLTLPTKWTEVMSKMKKDVDWKKEQDKSKDILRALYEKMKFKAKYSTIIDLTPSNSIASTVQDAQIACHTQFKDQHLYYLLYLFGGKSLVFCNSITCVKRVYAMFSILKLNVFQLHGRMQERQRLKNLDRFKACQNGALITTDVAARGIDIPHVQQVIHYQLPRSAEIYIHRCGRSGRAGQEGFSVSLVSEDDKKNYRIICDALSHKNGIPFFPVLDSFMEDFRKRIKIAKDIYSIESKMEKKSSNVHWFQQKAEEMDIALDEDNFADIFSSEKELRKPNRKLEKLKESLDDEFKKYIGQRGLTSHKVVTSDTLDALDNQFRRDMRKEFEEAYQ